MTEGRRRKFKGYAALDRRGSLVWGTLRTSAEEAQAVYSRHNPDPTGDGMGEQIVSVEIWLTRLRTH